MPLKSSRSTWACELKFPVWSLLSEYSSHAPRERVSWNCIFFLPLSGMEGHAPRERVSWNVNICKICKYSIVTLHVSVWVEIYKFWNFSTLCMSRSTWACELKCKNQKQNVSAERHAPRERVSWNARFGCTHPHRSRHAPRERVSWNCTSCNIHFSSGRSRSTWACELKWNYLQFLHRLKWSRSTWACELKFLKQVRKAKIVQVTLHVSVWVEICLCWLLQVLPPSRSTWACELKCKNMENIIGKKRSRSTWACELKCIDSTDSALADESRSTWACELK